MTESLRCPSQHQHFDSVNADVAEEKLETLWLIIILLVFYVRTSMFRMEFFLYILYLVVASNTASRVVCEDNGGY